MIVVLDTTETFADLRLDGSNFRMLKAYISRTRSRLAIPQIVVEETINHFREQLSEQVEAASTALRSIDRMLGESGTYRSPSIDQARSVEDFRRYLDMQIQELGGSVIAYGKVLLPDLIARSLGRRRPFDSSGQRGFRDAVLWESILKEVIPGLRDTEPVALVTRNSKDFGKEPELFPELQEDCRSRSKPNVQVRLFNGLQSFVDKEVKPNLEKLEAIHREIVQGQFKTFSLDAFLAASTESLRRAIDEHVRWYPDLGKLIPYLSDEFHSQHLQNLEQLPLEANVTDVWRVDDQRIAIDIQAEFPGSVMFQMRTKEYVQDGNQLLIQHKDEPIGMGGSFHLRITAILYEASGAVESHEVDDVRVDFGSENEHGAW
jgi:PIN domain-containing protein